MLEDGVVEGRIFLMPIGPRGRPWMWASGHHRAIERAVHGYEPTRLRWRRLVGRGIEIMKLPKLMWSKPPRITAPQPDAELVMNARREGRPPLGSQAMSGAERARRYRQRLGELSKQASER